MNKLKHWLIVGLMVFGWCMCANAFDPDKDIQVSFQKGHVVVTVAPSAHLSKGMLDVKLLSAPGKIQVGPLPAESAKDESGEGIYHGTVKIPVVGEGLQGDAKLEVSYQACSEGPGASCFPPTSKTLTVKAADLMSGKKTVVAAPEPKSEGNVPETAVVTPAQPIAPSKPVEPSQPTVAHPPVKNDRGVLWLLLVAFGMGLMTSLTPCVYPMIPITMAVLGAKGGGVGKGLALSIMLVLGMSVTYTALGVLAATTGSAFGSFAQSPWFLIPVSLIFAALALSLFGAYEIQLPQFLQSRLQGDGPRRGLGGAFVTGLVLGPLAAPCAGPFVGSMMIEIAKHGKVALGALAFFIYSLGMGVLFILVGTFSAGLPRSGDWLTRLKSFMGVVILGFAAWNVRLLLPEWANEGLWCMVLLVAAAVMGAYESAEGLLAQLRKGFAYLLLVVAILLGIRAVEHNQGITLLPRGGNAVVTSSAHVEDGLWITHDYEKAQAQAQKENKLVLVDTFAAWCAQCKELDHQTWPDPAVSNWLKQHAVPVRIDTHAVRKDLGKALEIQSYPTVILLTADGKELRRTYGFKPPKDMLAWLEGKNL